MEHTLFSKEQFNRSITATEKQSSISIKISYINNFEEITLSKQELHAFIGTLLHIQQRLK